MNTPSIKEAAKVNTFIEIQKYFYYFFDLYKLLIFNKL